MDPEGGGVKRLTRQFLFALSYRFAAYDHWLMENCFGSKSSKAQRLAALEFDVRRRYRILEAASPSKRVLIVRASSE